MTIEKAIVRASIARAAGRHVGIYSFICLRCSIISFTAWWVSSGYCSKRCSAVTRKAKKGSDSSHWTGGRHVRRGYVYVYQDDGQKYKYRAEHAVVMERKLGRRLLPSESVHHINGIRGDNRLENLELWVSPQPTGQRPFDLVRWVIDTYPAEVRTLLECKAAAESLGSKLSA